ncbi:hypothetical protein SAMN04488131_12223 [Flavobacterium xueshanense]|jgi:cytochrome bd-type quinol oxidase subunit 1|uniref:Uncharacterized protein n=1 Tax=Flavobacterium xueshanense TaxID=935223 RepID=A0A1I2IPQ1_9FLAO|nr:hypothetical protein [Flavobacterium xueshanense]SFF43680.1 hypothetical protein SAMN04488131_12223 [Flavobacterium xueshanense]
MFSQGQLVFAGLFFVAFIIAAIYSYRKDIKIHQEFYKGNYKILIGFGIFIGILFLIKVFFKR